MAPYPLCPPPQAVSVVAFNFLRWYQLWLLPLVIAF